MVCRLLNLLQHNPPVLTTLKDKPYEKISRKVEKISVASASVLILGKQKWQTLCYKLSFLMFEEIKCEVEGQHSELPNEIESGETSDNTLKNLLA